MYPTTLDTDDSLYLVHDSLRVRLLEDYQPGDTGILVEGDISRFPTTGFITLTDQCSELDDRALTFHYTSRTALSFDGLQLLVGFNDIVKPKRLTNVTQNVMAQHHNSIKDALIAVEEFVGIKGTIDTQPLGQTLEGRINFLRKLVLRPRAWFKVNKRIGVVPLTVTVTDLSFRDPTFWEWDFGDNSSSIVSEVICVTSMVPSGISEVEVIDLDGGTLQKTYYTPGIFDVKLTISNAFGTDTITLPELINARIPAPDAAVIEFSPAAYQNASAIDPLIEPFLYNHLLPGRINAKADTLISLEVIDNGEQAGDAITKYTWKLADDLEHFDSPLTNASYGIGGFYDIKVRTDTQFGAYRTTVLQNAINIIEKENLFLFIMDSLSTLALTKNATAYEFGLISETFKVNSRTSYAITRDFNFLDNTDPEYVREKREFLRNNGFSPRTTVASGNLGTGIVYWAENGTTISLIEYYGFTDVWNTASLTNITRPWNWASFATSANLYFMLGAEASYTPGSSPTNQVQQKVNFNTLAVTETTFTSANYKNGADELMDNVDATGATGNFSVYRSTWQNSTGYLLRNDGVGSFFRLKSFYQTQGILAEPIQYLDKLTDLVGAPKLEGQLVPLATGIYCFSNDSEVAVFNPTTASWAVSAPAANSASFRSLQDTTVVGFADNTNTLLATSDADHRAYLSFDYSPNVFIKFNEADLTFSILPARPEGEQFVAGIF